MSVSVHVLAVMSLQKAKSVHAGIAASQPSKYYRKCTATAITVMCSSSWHLEGCADAMPISTGFAVCRWTDRSCQLAPRCVVKETHSPSEY